MPEYCPNCGEKVQSHDNYCGNCGNQLIGVSNDGLYSRLDEMATGKRIDACQTQLEFLKEIDELSTDIVDAFSQFNSSMLSCTRAARKITDWVKTQSVSGNLNITTSKEEIGQKVEQYINYREEALDSLETMQELLNELSQRSPRSEFQRTTENYNEWIEQFEELIGIAESIIENLDRGLNVEGEGELVFEYETMKEVYSQGGEFLSGGISKFEETFNELTETTSKVESSVQNDVNYINNL